MDDAPPTTSNGAGVGDDVLLARAKADGTAFVAVFERHSRPIFRFAAHRVGAAAAEDVLAETYVRAFERRHRAYTTEGSLRAWLHAIARNLIADELRRQTRTSRAQARLRPPAEPEGPVLGIAADPDLLSAVETLREEEREALLLFAWGELSYAEIAVVTGVAIGTVRSRLSRARRRARAVLDASASEVAR